MRYAFVSAAVLALTSSAFAQTKDYLSIVLPIQNQNVPAGKPFDIVWQAGDYKTGTATIILLQGESQGTLQLGQTIATGVKNSAGKYTWNVPGDVPSFPLYGFKISQEDDKSTPAKDESKDADGKDIFQYSFPFHITGSASSGSSSSSGAAAGGSYATTVIELGTGPAYTPTPTPTPSAKSTTVTLVTSTKNATASHSTPKPSSNYTMTTPITTATPTATPTDGPPAQQTGNAAVSNAAVSGGLLAMVGALLMALAL